MKLSEYAQGIDRTDPRNSIAYLAEQMEKIGSLSKVLKKYPEVDNNLVSNLVGDLVFSCMLKAKTIGLTSGRNFDDYIHAEVIRFQSLSNKVIDENVPYIFYILKDILRVLYTDPTGEMTLSVIPGLITLCGNLGIDWATVLEQDFKRKKLRIRS